MWRALVVAVGLVVGVAYAEPGPEEAPSQKGPFGDPVEDVKEDLEDKRDEKQKAEDKRLAKLRAAQADKDARIVVLQWRGSDVDYRNETLRRNIRGRIARPSGKFYPDVDVYQAGRKEPDETLRPLDQRGVVPDTAIDRVMGVVRIVEAIPWNALDETEWGIKAHELKDLADEIWFIDRPELREPLFRLYTMIGYASENSNNPIPPFFEEVAGVSVNYYYYLAAAMASREPALMAKLTDSTLYGNVDNIKGQIEAGIFAPMTLNFEVAGDFDPERFTQEYEVFFNGVEDQIQNDQALYNVPPGIMDVYLRRSDGHSMSVRVEAVRLDREEIYGVRDQARKRMGLDFIDQLMEHPEQCIPDVDGDILNYLSIYQKLHPGADVFIAVPEGGSIHKIFLWRWDPEQGVLYRINDQTGGFPVRFVALVGTGLSFSGASFGVPEEVLEPQVVGDGNGTQVPPVSEIVNLQPAALPISYELRGHWGRLMVGVGLDFALNLADPKWTEVPQSRHRDHFVSQVDDGGEVEVIRNRILTDHFEDGAEGPYDVPAVKELTWQRGVFVTIGGVLGKDAAYGFGPRIAARTGWYNAPHAVDLTGHLGWSVKPPLKNRKSVDTRIFPVIDADLFGGVMLPYGDTIHLLTTQVGDSTAQNQDGVTQWLKMQRNTLEDSGCVDGRVGADPPEESGAGVGTCKFRKIGNPILNFGFTVKVGLTF